MPGGRPRKPTELKRAQGTLRKHRENKNQPKLPSGAPAIPEKLRPEALAEWRRLVVETLKMRVLTEMDRGVLILAADAYADWRESIDALAAAGSATYETEGQGGAVMFRARPECAIRSDAWRRYLSAIVQLGLTPAARAKVSAVDPNENEDPGAAFFN